MRQISYSATKKEFIKKIGWKTNVFTKYYIYSEALYAVDILKTKKYFKQE